MALKKLGKKGNRKNARVGNLSAILMICVALLLDALQFLFSFFHAVPYVGTLFALIVTMFISLLAFILFGIWFALYRVNYFTGKQVALKLLSAFGTLVIELTPFLDALPAITGGVVLMIVASRIEDFVGDAQAITNMVSARSAALREARAAGLRGDVRASLQEHKKQLQENSQIVGSLLEGRRVAGRPDTTERARQGLDDMQDLATDATENARELRRSRAGRRPEEYEEAVSRGYVDKPSVPYSRWQERLLRGKNITGQTNSMATNIPTEEARDAA